MSLLGRGSGSAAVSETVAGGARTNYISHAPADVIGSRPKRAWETSPIEGPRIRPDRFRHSVGAGLPERTAAYRSAYNACGQNENPPDRQDMRAATLENTFILSKDALFRDLNGEAVILDVDSGTYFGLNAVGTRMWQLIEQHGRLAAVFDELCREYEVAPDKLETDLLELVSRLAEARLGEVK